MLGPEDVSDGDENEEPEGAAVSFRRDYVAPAVPLVARLDDEASSASGRSTSIRRPRGSKKTLKRMLLETGRIELALLLASHLEREGGRGL